MLHLNSWNAAPSQGIQRAQEHHTSGLNAAYAVDPCIIRRGNVLYGARANKVQDVLDD